MVKGSRGTGVLLGFLAFAWLLICADRPAFAASCAASGGQFNALDAKHKLHEPTLQKNGRPLNQLQQCILQLATDQGQSTTVNFDATSPKGGGMHEWSYAAHLPKAEGTASARAYCLNPIGGQEEVSNVLLHCFPVADKTAPQAPTLED